MVLSPSWRSIIPYSLLAVAALLAACTPTFNWREVQSGEGYRVLFPGRPAQMQRRIDLNGISVDMTMQVATVDTMSFAVGAAHLPAGASLEAARAAMREQMVRNIHGTETAAREVTVGVVDSSGHGSGTAAGSAIEAGGNVTDARGQVHPTTMWATFTGTGERAVQAIVLGQPIDREAAATFFESLRLAR